MVPLPARIPAFRGRAMVLSRETYSEKLSKRTGLPRASSSNNGGDPLAQFRLSEAGTENRRVGVAVDIDKARGRQLPNRPKRRGKSRLFLNRETLKSQDVFLGS
jgi:hypothetical protein